jgi:hypothetical protein
MRACLRRFVSILAVTAVSGCATLPAGPSVRVMPAPGKTFEQFQADDAICRQWAGRQIGMTPGEAVNNNMASGAAVGTLVGAAAGAAIGAASGDAAAGAAIGAGSGLLVGTASGANAGQVYDWEAQRRYDIAYEQCMYIKGNQIPGMVIHSAPRSLPPPPPGGMYGVPPDYREPK